MGLTAVTVYRKDLAHFHRLGRLSCCLFLDGSEECSVSIYGEVHLALPSAQVNFIYFNIEKITRLYFKNESSFLQSFSILFPCTI